MAKPARHRDPEVIVVGGGPAGATAALLLARAGRRVTIVERERFPRPKPCGDCLSAAATQLLDELGLLEAVLRAGAAALEEWRIRSPSGHVCSGRFESHVRALALERSQLDAVLLDAAVDAGAEVLLGRATALQNRDAGGRGVQVRDGSGELHDLRAPLLVGADGLRSMVARRAGLVRRRPRLRKVSLTTHGTGPAGDLRHGEMHVLEGGCFGLAPAGNMRFNLTLVVDATRAGDLGELGPETFFHRSLERAPAVADLVDPSTLDLPFLASGPFDWPTRSPVAEGIALVGDAAGYYDPFTGQGVYQALAGARALAEALAGVPLTDPVMLGRALDDYAKAARRLKRPARRVQRVVEAALGGRRRADTVLRRLARAPAAMDRLVEVTGDLRRPASLLSPRVVSSLILPPSPEIP